MRLLHQALGSSVYSVTTTLCVFMAGSAIGCFVFGRLADRWDTAAALRMYGYMQLGVAGCGALVPTAMVWAGGLYVWSYRHLGSSFALVATERVIVSALILLAPSVLMGGTFPVMVRYVARQRATFGNAVGRLYSLNTAGGVAGCAAAGFFLIEAMGIRGASYWAVAVSLLVGLAALALGWGEREPSTREEEPAGEHELPRPAQARARAPALAAAVAGVSGAAALGYEVLWTRVLLFFSGNTVYSFAIILITFLSGLAIGAYVFGKVADRTRDTAFWLGVVQWSLGLLAVASPWVLCSMFQWLGPTIIAHRGARLALMRHSLMASAAGFLFATVLMGGTLPLALKWFRSGRASSGRTAGVVVGANTVGAAIGPLVAGFVLIPWVGIYHSVLVLASVNLGLGVALVAGRERGGGLKLGLTVSAAAVAVLSIWRGWSDDPFARYVAEKDGDKLIAVEQGPDCTVTVVHKPDEPWLLIDGMQMAVPGFGMAMRGHLPMLLHPNARRVLVIGFGTGTTAGTVGADYPDASVDCVELSATVVRAERHFRDSNRDVMNNPRVTVIVEDARNYLACTDKQYDVIISDPPQPFGAHAAGLYSMEFYDACRSRLAGGGLLLQWIPLFMAPGPELKTMIRTFAVAFPDFTMWSGGPGTVHLIWVRGELRISLSRLQQKMNRGSLAAHLAESGVHTASGLVSELFFMDGASARRWLGPGPVVTDDRPIIEFAIPRLFESADDMRTRLVGRSEMARHRTLPDRFLTP